jgi:hypothetical protein
MFPKPAVVHKYPELTELRGWQNLDHRRRDEPKDARTEPPLWASRSFTAIGL